MSTPKPHIRPKPDPYRQRSESPRRSPLYDPEESAPRDPFAEHAAVMAEKPAGRVMFREDDCLR